MSRRVPAMPTLAAALITLAACGDNGRTADSSPADGTAAASASATATAVTGPVVSDERIIPVNGDLAEVVYALGLGDHVVATDVSATYPPEADATPKIGYQRTLVAETILSFEPTVVLADELAGPAEVLDQLENAGVRVVTVDRQATLAAPAAKIRAVAEALGVPEQGEQLVAQLDADLMAARARATAVVRGERPRVLALYLRGERVQQVFGDGSGIDAVIEAAGGIDVGTELGVVENAELSTESVVAAEPDILLVTTTGLESIGGVDGLLAMPGIDRTPAARERRVLAYEDQYLYGLGPRTGQLVGELVDAFDT